MIYSWKEGKEKVQEKIHFYHINDLHSHFENWPQIEQFLYERNKLHQETGEESIIVDLGDHVDRAHPYTEATLGRANVTLLNRIGCQYATIGNNEGITLSKDELDALYEEASFQVIVSNLYNKDGERPQWAEPYWIHVTKKGTRIAFIGATAYYRLFYKELDWTIKEPIEEIRKLVAVLKGKCDVMVLLSHLGLDMDEAIASEMPEIRLILGAHTHHILHEGKHINDTLLCCTGMGGRYTGHVEMTLSDQHQLTGQKAVLNEMRKERTADEQNDWNLQLYNKGKELLSEPIIKLKKPMEVDWFNRSELTQLLCDQLREHCQADCAFLNAGLLLGTLKKGIITKFDIHSICPHPINPCTVKLTGARLKEVLLESQNEGWPHLQLKGFGFRGKIMGIMQYSNVDIVSSHEIYIGKKPLDPEKVYTLAIPDMFTFGRFFPEITRNESKKYYLPEFLRDLLTDALKNRS